jgi:shikimate dehydrogenase
VPKELLRPGQVVFDMVYRPHQTRLLREAQEAGCTVVHGIDMLLYQAALQFERWTETPCPLEAMRASVSDLTQ